MNESIIIQLIQNIAILLAFAMLYENFWLKDDNPRSLISKIFTGFILGGIGITIMSTNWELIPGIVFDTRSVMLAISGLFFGTLPTIIAIAVSGSARMIMGGEGMYMGIAVIVMSGSIGILWGKFRKQWQHKKIVVELITLGIVVHLAMLTASLLLPSEKIFPTLGVIVLPVMLIHTSGTVLLGLLMYAQKHNMENRMAKLKLYEADAIYSHNLLVKQKQLQKHINKYSKLARKFKSQNNELKRARDKAEESDRLKSAFLANLSHEIRTPMNAIVGFTDLLELNNYTDEKRKEYTQIIRKSGDYLLSIINDIIEISQIEAGQVKLKNAETDIENLLQEIYTTLKYSLNGNGKINFILQKPSEQLPGNILIDEVKLKQIIINLLNNAFKYTSEGEISFGCYLKDDSRITFFVKDTGIGIEPENQKVIFERFRQITKNNYPGGGGSGLGLAIVKAYSDLMGGSISVNSEPGKGSEFEVTFPLKLHKSMDPDKNKNTSTLCKNMKSRTILVAEDEEVNWFLLEHILSSDQFNLIRAANGREAVELCRQNDGIEMVLMDIKMPELNGYDALEEIRKFKPGLPVIAQTAYALPSDIERLKKSFTDYITKPINRNLLLQKISAISNKSNNLETVVSEG